jgi:hypothetical protein
MLYGTQRQEDAHNVWNMKGKIWCTEHIVTWEGLNHNTIHTYAYISTASLLPVQNTWHLLLPMNFTTSNWIRPVTRFITKCHTTLNIFYLTQKIPLEKPHSNHWESQIIYRWCVLITQHKLPTVVYFISKDHWFGKWKLTSLKLTRVTLKTKYLGVYVVNYNYVGFFPPHLPVIKTQNKKLSVTDNMFSPKTLFCKTNQEIHKQFWFWQYCITFEQNLLQIFKLRYTHGLCSISCDTKSHTFVSQKTLGQSTHTIFQWRETKNMQLNKECE